MDRATAWSITINNPTPADTECIALARQKGWKVEGQLEKGENGTLHYQLMVKTPQVRFSALKKSFPRGHIEVARNVPALRNYVTKEETRQGDLPTSQEKYPSMSKLWELISDYLYESDYSKYFRNPGDLYIPGSRREEVVMAMFDDAILQLICDGYYVETLGVNPQVRCAWKKYCSAILTRLQRQIDRQTANALEQAVEIPVVEDINGHSCILRQEEIDDTQDGSEGACSTLTDSQREGQCGGETTDFTSSGESCDWVCSGDECSTQ